MWQNTLYLAAAIICTGVGMSNDDSYEVMPNPADGLAQAMVKARKNMGFGKRPYLTHRVAIACVIGICCSDKRIIGNGIGTVAGAALVKVRGSI